MDENEREEILYRLDERTKRVDEKLSNFDDRISENREDIETNDERITANSGFLDTLWTGMKVAGAATLAAFSGVGAYLADLIHL
jgi:hypothetical protein